MEHFYQNIEGWAAFRDLYRDVVSKAKDGDVFVEVGSWLGKSAAFMAVEIINSGKDISFYCVDPWQDGGPDLRNTPYFKNLKEPVYDIFLRNTTPVATTIKALRGDSVKIASTFTDKSVSFLMLDGDHNYPAVKHDIEAWMPKMAKGGLISGDDALWPGVKQSVFECFGTKAQTRVLRQHPDYRKTASYWTVQL